jgi:hypothetical protein
MPLSICGAISATCSAHSEKAITTSARDSH